MNDGHDDVVVDGEVADDEDSNGGSSPKLTGVLIGLFFALLGGVAVVSVASALSAGDDCGPYGYGGYHCDDTDYDDGLLNVFPDTDLVDREQVNVLGARFDPPFSQVVIVQCVAPTVAGERADDCDDTTTGYGYVERGGNFFASRPAVRNLTTPGAGNVDCALTGCVFRATTYDGYGPTATVLEEAVAPMAFDPDAPPIDYTDATLVADPAVDLSDREVVTLTGADFDPRFHQFGAVMCIADRIADEAQDACDLSTLTFGYVDGDGGVSLQMRVRRILDIGGEAVDCAVVECVVGGGTIGSDAASAIEGADAAVSFDPDVPPIPDLEVDVEVLRVKKSWAELVITCNRDAQLYVDVSVQQIRDGQYAYAYGFIEQGGTCDEQPERMRVRLRDSGSTKLGKGLADYWVWVSAYDDVDYANADAFGQVQLPSGRIQ